MYSIAQEHVSSPQFVSENSATGQFSFDGKRITKLCEPKGPLLRNYTGNYHNSINSIHSICIITVQSLVSIKTTTFFCEKIDSLNSATWGPYRLKPIISDLISQSQTNVKMSICNKIYNYLIS